MTRRDPAAVRRVQRLDGSASVLRVWRDAETGWQSTSVSRLTADNLQLLREDGVRVVRLRRLWHIAEVPLIWFPAQHTVSTQGRSDEGLPSRAKHLPVP